MVVCRRGRLVSSGRDLFDESTSVNLSPHAFKLRLKDMLMVYYIHHLLATTNHFGLNHKSVPDI